MPSLLDPDDDQTLAQTGAGLLRIGQSDSDQGAALADLYRRVTEPQPQGDVTPRWDADNPVGTETTQTLRQATPILPGTLQAHAQVQQAMELAPTIALGMLGDAPGIRGYHGSGADFKAFVFDPATIEILRKYGIAGLGLGLGAAATQQGNGT
jgi:hypothetical protein